MFERHSGGEKAVLVHICFQREDKTDLVEFEELASSAGAYPVATIIGNRKTPDAKYFVGKGKAEEIRASVIQNQAGLVIFDHALSPAQERNLEQLFECRVLDRTGLILDIFAQRARSFEGKLQVELAQLRHLSTRLIRGWTHLERQKGGIGLRGPGETQLETDRRLLAQRIKQINKRLAKVEKQREQGRRGRKRAEMPTVSLVGYTNAGKSTLFNLVTGAEVYAADQLFATLDATLRRVEIADAGPIIFADTVGFVKKLPHDLVAAFKSTLEETRQSHLLLHVIDATCLEREQRIQQVNDILSEIDAKNVKQIEIYNKIDLLDNVQPHIDRNSAGNITRVWLSSKSGLGLNLLIKTLKDFFGQDYIHGWIRLGAEQAKTRAELFELNVVNSEEVSSDGGFLIEVSLQKTTAQRLGLNESDFKKYK